MSQDLLYSVIARPSLGAENLVYRRRVAKSSEKDNAKRTESKEQKFTKDQNRFSAPKEGLAMTEYSKSWLIVHLLIYLLPNYRKNI